MLTRLKAALRLLLAEQYVLATLPKGSEMVETECSCSLVMMDTTALYCLRTVDEALEKRQMNSLVSEAQAILEKKV